VKRLPVTQAAASVLRLRGELRRLRNLARFDAAFWVRSAERLLPLLEAQQEVSRHAPTPWYDGENRGRWPDGTEYCFPPYRSEEAAYWLHLALWLWEDGRARPPRRLLDVGPGYGTLSVFAQRLTGCELCWLDWSTVYASPELVRSTRGNRFATGNVELAPIPFEGTFDAILFSEVLEHLNFDPTHTLRRLADALAPAGRLYLSTPDAGAHGRETRHHRHWTQMPAPDPRRPVVDTHVYLYDESELRDVTRAAGLAIERLDRSPGTRGAAHLNAVCVHAG